MAVSPTALQSFGANASSSTYLRHLVLKRGLLRFAVLALDLLSSQRGAHVVQHGEDITQVLAAHTYFGGVGGRAGQHETRGETRNAPSLSPSLYLSLYDDPPLGAPRTRLPPPDLLASFFSIRPRRSSASFARLSKASTDSAFMSAGLLDRVHRAPLGSLLHFGTTESPFALVSRENNSGSSKKIEGGSGGSGSLESRTWRPRRGRGRRGFATRRRSRSWISTMTTTAWTP